MRARLRAVAIGTFLFALVACGGGGGGRAPRVAQNGASIAGGDPVAAARNSGAGDFAADFLRDVIFTSIVLEIDFVEGFGPDPSAVNLLLQRLQERCSKPDGVTAVLDDMIPIADALETYDLSDIRALEDAWRTRYADGDTGEAVMYFLYLNGRSSEDQGSTRVAAITHRGSSIAVFKEAILMSSALPNVQTAVEEAVVAHEAGHLIGLVNNGVPMVDPHEDFQHRGHDVSDECLMFWQIVIVGTGPVTMVVNQFDAECIADVQAFGGL